MKQEFQIVCSNRKARHEYEIISKMEAGLVLVGTEVKSLRLRHANLTDTYAEIRNDELYLINFQINPYSPAERFNHNPLRVRKLLMHKKEINRLYGQTQQKGLTLIPLSVYFKNSKAKVELALARGKRLYDKREAKKEREISREMERVLRNR